MSVFSYEHGSIWLVCLIVLLCFKSNHSGEIDPVIASAGQMHGRNLEKLSVGVFKTSKGLRNTGTVILPPREFTVLLFFILNKSPASEQQQTSTYAHTHTHSLSGQIKIFYVGTVWSSSCHWIPSFAVSTEKLTCNHVSMGFEADHFKIWEHVATTCHLSDRRCWCIYLYLFPLVIKEKNLSAHERAELEQINIVRIRNEINL